MNPDRIIELMNEYGRRNVTIAPDGRVVIRGTYFEDVGAFHQKFGLPINGDTQPQQLSSDLLAFRGKFMLEELAEFFVACGRPEVGRTLKTVGMALTDLVHEPQFNHSLEDAADALADLVYVALGTAHFMGLPFDAVWAEVQRANMAKERAKGGDDPRSKRRHASDVVKPEGWTPPNHGPAIAEAASHHLAIRRTPRPESVVNSGPDVV